MLQFVKENGGFDVCSKTNIMNKLIETSKGSEKTKNNKRKKDIDSERENPKKKSREAPLCCTCDSPMNFDNKAKKVVVKCPDCGIWIHRLCIRSITGCENCNKINSY